MALESGSYDWGSSASLIPGRFTLSLIVSAPISVLHILIHARYRTTSKNSVSFILQYAKKMLQTSFVVFSRFEVWILYKHLTRFTREKAWQLLLNTATERSMPFGSTSMLWDITYVPAGYGLPYAVCYSRNLRIFSQEDQETQKLYGEKASQIQYIDMPSKENEAFYPWMVAPIFFSIHSSVIPENPLFMGKRLRLGHQYKVSFRLEEEHLLPLPYATNCTDYDALWRQNDKDHGLRRKLCPGCEGENMMHKDKHELFPNHSVIVKPIISFQRERCFKCFYDRRMERCKRDCKTDCVKQKYHYTVEETPLEPTSFWRGNHVDGNISKGGSFCKGVKFAKMKSESREIKIKKKKKENGEKVKKKKGRIEMELFSYIGGLIGCWLGISVWAFVDIIEGNCRRLLRLIQKLKQKSKKKLQKSYLIWLIEFRALVKNQDASCK
ncbi:uncharacterized protein CEXT_709791 [Caerostris extrusa]|uniref:Uncharacterized protein n=1 Tax=Caerostris extrusa TaxID=172846 RepID=A0AAV4SG57_CAEEX|nr:uncharacterized protein CEXT_709791 [Caerostris extrusa]